ncbi:unnamed protein product [Moneuplotes crassus]|uniref:Amino acid transporter transmembrane domain-containing protein n=1 Tax=Euplotes crassus TaxID=5936 RepID=A0AAD1UFM1_EUPCR|nr:unnamed protein product [Moneuplotes crassus]
MPSMDEIQHNKQSSYITIFAIWNSMVGGGLVSHPWAFSESGILLSLAINFCVMMVCFYTCNLVVICGKGDYDFLITLNRFFGKKGQYAAIVTTIIMLYGGVLIYYQLQTQTLFPFIIGIKDIFTETYTASVETDVDFSTFSLTWTSIIIFLPLYFIVCMKDRSIFIKISSIGVVFIIIQIIFVVVMFIYSLTNTEYYLTLVQEESDGPENIAMFHTNFQSLTGMLAAGYYLHQLGLPIILDNKDQDKNTRDTFCGYFLVFFTYCIIGICGYFGFSGSYFKGMPIKQNLLNMFPTSNPIATLVRVVSFIQIFSVYPLLFHIVRVNFFKAIGKIEFEGYVFYIYNFIASLPCVVLAIWYPRVGDMLGYCGSILGIFAIYLLPAILHLRRTWLEVKDPEALYILESSHEKEGQGNLCSKPEAQIFNDPASDELKERFLDKEQDMSDEVGITTTNGNIKKFEKKPMSKFITALCLDSLAVGFGMVVFVLQFITF